jgi:Yip1 domain
MAGTATPAPEAQASLGTFGRLTGVLFNPKPTFADIARRPSWIAPIVLLSLLGIGVGYVMNQRVDWGTFIRQQAEKSSRFAQMTDQQKDQALAPQIKYAPAFTYAVGLLATFIIAVILAGVYLGAFKLSAGSELNFGKSLAIVSHALMPSAIASVLGIITMLLKQPGDVNPQNFLVSNVGALLSNDAPRWEASLGASLDIFWIWTLILLAIGYSATNPKKLSTARAAGFVFGIWVVWVLVKVGWAVAFS